MISVDMPFSTSAPYLLFFLLAKQIELSVCQTCVMFYCLPQPIIAHQLNTYLSEDYSRIESIEIGEKNICVWHNALFVITGLII